MLKPMLVNLASDWLAAQPLNARLVLKARHHMNCCHSLLLVCALHGSWMFTKTMKMKRGSTFYSIYELNIEMVSIQFCKSWCLAIGQFSKYIIISDGTYLLRCLTTEPQEIIMLIHTLYMSIGAVWFWTLLQHDMKYWNICQNCMTL